MRLILDSFVTNLRIIWHQFRGQGSQFIESCLLRPLLSRIFVEENISWNRFYISKFVIKDFTFTKFLPKRKNNQCGKTRNYLSLKKNSSNQLCSNFCEKSVRENFHTGLHTLEITEIYSHRKNISSNHLYSNFLVKMLLSRNFCQKSVRVNFRNFPHCV